MAYTLLAFSIVLVLMLGTLFALDRRSRRTERNLVAPMAHLGVPASEPSPPSDEIKAIANSPGGKVGAIKAYRAQTGLSLVEAKEAIERLEAAESNGTAKGPNGSAD